MDDLVKSDHKMSSHAWERNNWANLLLVVYITRHIYYNKQLTAF